MFHKSFGRLEFDPIDKTKKHLNQSSWKKTAMIKLDCDIHLYYCWFLKKRYNLVLNQPIRESHITIINDKIDSENLVDKYNQTREKWNGQIIEFEYLLLFSFILSICSIQ